MTTQRNDRPQLTLPFILALTALCWSGPGTARAANVSLKTSDALGTSSWTGSTNWDNNAAPSGANDYFTKNFTLRTPDAVNNPAAFAGASLSVDPGGTLMAKHNGNFTNANLKLNGGTIWLGGGAAYVTNYGAIALNATTNSWIATDVSSRGIHIRSAISDALAPAVTASLIISNVQGVGVGVTLSGSNTFTNPLLITGNSYVRANSTNALGATNLTTITAGSTLDVNGLILGPTGGGWEHILVGGGGLTNNGAIVNNGSSDQINALRHVTLSGNTTFGGTRRWDIRASGTGYLIGNGYTLTKVGANQVSFVGLGNTDLGDINVNAGTLSFETSSTMGRSGNTLTIASGAQVMFWASSVSYDKKLTLNGGTLYKNNGNSTLTGPITLAANSTFRSDNNSGTDLTLNGVLSGPAGFTKTGNGRLILGTANTYAGPTWIADGTLRLNHADAVAGSSLVLLSPGKVLDLTALPGLTVRPGQALGGSGVIMGSVLAGLESIIVPGGDGVAGTLDVSNDLVFADQSIVRVDFSSLSTVEGGNTNDLVRVTNLTLQGTVYVVPSFLEGAPVPAGTYTLFRYSGSLVGGAANLALLGTRLSASFDDSVPGEIRVTFSGSGTNLVWRGDGLTNTWDTGTTVNWLNGGNPDVFYSGDAVLFDNTGSNTPAINLVGGLGSAVTTVDASKDYTFSGSGFIAGGQLIKQGSGTLQVNTPNTHKGGTFVGGGILRVNHADALGANGATVVATNGGQVDINGVNQSAKGFTYTASGAGPDGLGAIVNKGEADAAGANSGVKNLILVGDTTVGTITRRFDIGGGGGFVDGGGFKLIKTGPWHMPFRGPFVSNLAEVIINQGRFYAEQYNNQLNSVVTVNPGAMLGAYAYTTPGGITNSATINLNGGHLGVESSQAAGQIAVWTGPVNVNAPSFLNSGQAGGNSDTMLRGTLNGSAPLTVANSTGTRMVILAANNDATYSGRWTINAGNTLRTIEDGSFGTGPILNHGTVDIGRTNPFTLANPIAGSGAVRFFNNAQVTVDGTASIVVGGTVSVSQDTPAWVTLDAGADVQIGGELNIGNPANVAGHVIQNGGRLACYNTGNGLRLGHWPNNISTYTVNGGTLFVPGAPIRVGWDGIGILNINGGTVMTVGLNPDANSNTGAIGGTNETVRLSGGVLKLGSYGIQPGGAAVDYDIILGGGTLSAYDNWGTSAKGRIHFTNSPGTVTVDPAGFIITLAGTNFGSGGLTLNGAGTLALSGPNLYQGDTVVERGILLVNGLLGTNVGTLNVNGGLLAGSGSTRLPVAVAAAGTVSAGPLNAAGTLTVSNNLTLSGGAMLMDLTNNVTTGGGNNDLLDVKNTLTLSGTVPVAFNFLAGAPVIGSAYTFARGGTLVGGVANLTNFSHRYPATFGVSGNDLTVTFTNGTAENLVWRGDGAANLWEAGPALNWWNGTALDYFGAADNVTFDDTGSNNVPVVLSGVLLPASLMVNASQDYIFAGAGRIGGAINLVKQGSGTLVLSNAHDFTGNTIVSDGTLAIVSDGCLGPVPAAVNGKLQLNGTLRLLDSMTLNGNRRVWLGPPAGTGGGTVDVPGSSFVTIPTVISNNAAGTATLTKTGTGTLNLTADNWYTGGTIVNEGILEIRGANNGNSPVGKGTLTINSGATVIAYTHNPIGQKSSGTRIAPVNLQGGTFLVDQYCHINNITLNAGTIGVRPTCPAQVDGLDIGNLTGVTPNVPPVVTVQAAAQPSVIASKMSVNSPLLLDVADGAASVDLDFTGVLAGGNPVTKIGAGLVRFAALTNNFASTLTISNGTVALGSNTTFTGGVTFDPRGSGVLDVSQVLPGFALGNAQNIVGNGTVRGNVVVANNAQISPLGFAAAGTLSFSNNLTFTNGSRLNWNLADVTTVGGGVNDLLEVAGDLTLAGPVTLTIYQLNGQLAVGAYRLINYGGALVGNPTNLVVVNNTANTRYTYTIDTSTPGQVNLVVAGAAASLVWQGNVSGAWNFTDLNWLNGAAPDRFFNADAVLFDDTALQYSVTLPGAVAPGGVTVDGPNNFTLTGSGRITGPTGLTKNGTGTLTLGCGSNDFTGPIQVNAGVLKAGTIGAFGLAPHITIANGAQVDFNGITRTARQPYTMAGFGPDGRGALISGTGGGHGGTCPIGDVTLTGDTGVWSASGQVWDFYGGVFNAQGYKLTKLGPGRFDLFNTRVTNLAELNIVEGIVYSEGPLNETFGSNIIINAGTVLSPMNNCTNSGSIVLNGGHLGAGGNASFGSVWTGPITLNSNSTVGFYYIYNSLVNMSNNVYLLGPISGPGSLTKIGWNPTNANYLFLGGTNTYTGDTIIQVGRLVLLPNASIANSARIITGTGLTNIFDVTALPGGFTLAAGQTLGGGGTVWGDVQDSPGAIIAPGASIGTLTLTSNLTLNGGGTLVFELGPVTNEGGVFNDLLNLNNLTVTGPTTIRLVPVSNAFASATYVLMNYSGTLTGEANLSVVTDVRGVTATLDFSVPNKVLVTISGTPTPANLIWLGDYNTAQGTTNWDAGISDTWYDGFISTELFYHGDSVMFNDIGDGSGVYSTNINLVGTLMAGNIVASNSAYEFTLLGSGAFSGASFTKLLDGTFTIANSGPNTLAGPVDLQAGILRIGNGGPAGALPNVTISNAATLVFNRSDNVTVPNLIVGSGLLEQRGPGVLTLSGASGANFTGPIEVSGGVLKPTSVLALGTNNVVTVLPGGTLDVNGQNLGDTAVTVSGAGVGGWGAIINSGGTVRALRFLTLAGDAAVGGNGGRWDIADSGGSLSGAVSTGGQPFKLSKVGANQVEFGNVIMDPALGDIDVVQGTLVFRFGTNTGGLIPNLAGNPASNLVVRGGATLSLYILSNVLDKVLVLDPNATLLNNSGNNILAGPVNLVGNATINVNAHVLTVSNGISGTGILNKIGGGTLRIGDAGGVAAPVSVPINVAAGTLEFRQTNDLTLSEPVVGAGNVTHGNGAGTVTFNGGLVAGTLSLQSTSFSNQVVLGENTSNRLANIAVGPGAGSGALTIGTNAVLVVTNNFMLGEQNTYTGMVHQLGGDVTVNGMFRIGHWPNNISVYTMHSGSITLTADPGGINENAGSFNIGIDGVGVFHQLGGTVNAASLVLDNRGQTTLGSEVSTFALEGGRFIVGRHGIGTGNNNMNTVRIYLGGGTLGASANWSSTLNMTLTGTNGNLTFETGFSNLLVGMLSGPGGLNKTGPGILNLAGANSYTGTTVVSNGTLLYNGALAPGAGQVTVAGGTLGGNGTINAPVVVLPGGTLAPGTSIGTLTVNGDVTLSGDTVMEINRNAPQNADRLAVATTLNLGGSLIVRHTGLPLAAGDIFNLFDAGTFTGNFAGVTLPALGPGLYWDTTKLAVDGTITVETPPTITDFTPASQSVECGGTATFTVTATGTALTYTWFHNSTPIPGANGPVLTLNGVTPADAGNYTVLVTNGVGSAVGGPGVLAVVDTTAPVITTCPANRTLNLSGPNCGVPAPDLTGEVVATDTCSSVTVSQSPPEGTLLPAGTNLLTFQVADTNGNVTTCAAEVVVQGNGPITTNHFAAIQVNQGLLLPMAKILGTDVHPEGRPMSISGVLATSTNGGTVELQGGTNIFYLPPTNFVGTDAFTYTNTDCAGLSTTGQVVVEVRDDGPSMNIVSITWTTNGSDQVITIRAAGVPGYTYAVQRSPNVSSGPWTTMATPTANSQGRMTYMETNPPSPSFYRTKYPASP